jgi:hypothetical protein
MGWRDRPKVELGVPLPKLTNAKGFITIEGHGVGPLDIPMFKVRWSNAALPDSQSKSKKKKQSSQEEETETSWIHAYDTVDCPLALLEYVARDNYDDIRMPKGLNVEVSAVFELPLHACLKCERVHDVCFEKRGWSGFLKWVYRINTSINIHAYQTQACLSQCQHGNCSMVHDVHFKKGDLSGFS